MDKKSSGSNRSGDKKQTQNPVGFQRLNNLKRSTQQNIQDIEKLLKEDQDKQKKKRTSIIGIDQFQSLQHIVKQVDSVKPKNQVLDEEFEKKQKEFKQSQLLKFITKCQNLPLNQKMSFKNFQHKTADQTQSIMRKWACKQQRGYLNVKRNFPIFDQIVYQKNFLGKTKNYLFGMFDGHGERGDKISKYLSEKLNETIMAQNIELKNLSVDYRQQVAQKVESSLVQLHHEMEIRPDLGAKFSGSNFCGVMIMYDRCVVTSCGNIQALLVSVDPESLDDEQKKDKHQDHATMTGLQKFETIDLDASLKIDLISTEHAIDIQEERFRILNCNATISQAQNIYKEKYGPKLIWMNEDDKIGIQSTRTIGYHCGTHRGILSTPQSKEFDLNEHDKFIIISSDGLWQVLKHYNIVEIVTEHYQNNDPEEAANSLIRVAIDKCEKYGEKPEDMSCVIIFLN